MSTKIEKASELCAQFRLGDWLVEPGLNRISRGGTVVQLESKAVDVLVYLAARAGELADKRDVQDAVWQTEFVSYNAVSGRISELREALGDDAKDPRYIETIPKRGYRLIAEVSFGPLPQSGAGVLAGAGQERLDERSPYPGLAPFNESDSEDFFGREAEIAALWRKIASRRLLAVVGPSGAGKSSLVRAGVVARAPPGWRAVVCQPGDEPFLAVARALAPDLAGDAEEMRRLLVFHDLDVALAVAARWRGRWDEALLVVDQFEELFTLNPEPVREHFVELLRRLVDGAGIHVVLVLRDDFLLDCQRHPPLLPIFSDLTPVGPPAGRELRRALIEPAARRLHGFEGESMVDEMVGEVEAERGALPLLAFAVARLWELRDRDRRLLTREAYERIGGVGGALAQHAEATLEAIGQKQLPIVRELFRNLVTAHGTRAARDVDELLSVFDEGSRAEARSVLNALTDARLLTSFEDEAAAVAAGGTRHRVEVVHESLLQAWPRLVEWQARDAVAAHLRDQLRQAARIWDERDRPDDLLWSGSAYREYAVWREGYPGSLSELEEAFARSMTQLADRRRRRRRTAVTAAIVVLVAVAAALTLLWRRSVQEARRAEARKLIALGGVELDRNPAGAVAYARASLEVADSVEARMLAVEALWAGPPTLFVTAGLPASSVMTELVHCLRPAFSQDGRRLACGGWQGELSVYSDDGGEPLRITELPRVQDSRGVSFVPGDDRLLTWLDGDPSIRVFSATGAQLDTLPSEATDLLVLDGDTIATFGAIAPGDSERAVRVWSLADHSSRLLGRWRLPTGFQAKVEGLRPAALDPRLRYLATGAGTEVRLVGLVGPEAGREIVLGTHQAKVRELAFTPDGSRLASVDETGGFRVWPVGSGQAFRTFDAPVQTRLSRLGFDAFGSKLGWASDSGALVWSLSDPPDAAPRLLRGTGEEPFGAVAFDPEGRWAAAGRISGWLFMWSLASPYPRVLHGNTQGALDLAFTADSRYLASCGLDGARLWPLSPDGGHERLVSLGEEYWCVGIAADATSQSLLVAAPELGAFLVQPDGAMPHKLRGVPPTTLYSTALDTRAGLAAVGVSAAFTAREMAIHVVDLGSGATRALQLLDHESVSIYEGNVCSLGIAADGSLISGGDGGVYRWNVASGERTKICGGEGLWGEVAVSRSGRSMIAGCWDGQTHELFVVDLETGAKRPITSHGGGVTVVAMDPTGERIATGCQDGAVRVGWANGEEPHLLLGHRQSVSDVEFSPDGKWLASAAGTEIFLWPMPDLSKPPLHTLPHDQLLAKLGTLTNLRVVSDDSSPTGWKVEVGPFPGWAVAPEWNP